jgi:hypothetical protein
LTQYFEAACDPFALGRGFDEDARPQPVVEQRVEARSLGLDAALDQLTAFGQDADLAGVLMDVDPDVFHG